MSSSNQASGPSPSGSNGGPSGAGLPPSTQWYEHSRAVWPVALAIVFEIFAIVAIALRLWSHRLNSKKQLAAHDWAILLFSTGTVVLLILATVLGGLGQHTQLLSNPLEQLQVFGKIYVANSPIWAAAISSVKFSILLLYIKIFKSAKWFKVACRVLMGIQGLWFVAVTFEALLLCQPLALNWNPTLPGHCGDTLAAYLSAHIINLVLDVLVALVPLTVLWKLQMKRSKKIEISGLFALGAAICGITIARIVLIKDLVATDITHSTAVLFFFTILEPLLGIVLACLPVLRPAAQRIGSALSTTGRSWFHSDGSAGASGGRLSGAGAEPSGFTGSSVSSKDFKRAPGSSHVQLVAESHYAAKPLPVPRGQIQMVCTWDVEDQR